jgi:hypothetical protein
MLPPMADRLLLLLLVVNAPLYVVAGHCCFGDTRRFFRALRGTLRAEPDWPAAWRFAAWAALCAVLVFAEHRILLERLA